MALNDDIPNGEEDEDDIEYQISTLPPEESQPYEDLLMENEAQLQTPNKEIEVIEGITTEEPPKSKTQSDSIEITLEEQVEVTPPLPRGCNPRSLGTTGIIRLIIITLLIATLLIVFILTLIPNSPSKSFNANQFCTSREA